MKKTVVGLSPNLVIFRSENAAFSVSLDQNFRVEIPQISIPIPGMAGLLVQEAMTLCKDHGYSVFYMTDPVWQMTGWDNPADRKKEKESVKTYSTLRSKTFL